MRHALSLSFFSEEGTEEVRKDIKSLFFNARSYLAAYPVLSVKEKTLLSPAATVKSNLVPTVEHELLH